jgi:hypothetical protein
MIINKAWTTCPYRAMDGRVNPDVRTLVGATAFNDMSNAVFYNAIAYVLSGQSSYASQVVNFLDAFFIQNDSKMNPRVDYGQVIRGPQKQQGAYEGIVDFRSMINVANAILLLRQTKSPQWTTAMDDEMMTWTKSYVQWLQTSNLGARAKVAAK